MHSKVQIKSFIDALVTVRQIFLKVSRRIVRSSTFIYQYSFFFADLSLFSTKTLVETNSDHQVEVRTQVNV